MDVVGVQAGGGLVQDIDGLAGGPAGQFRGQLHPLGLPPGEGGGGLADFEVTQPHGGEGFQLPPELGEVGKEL